MELNFRYSLIMSTKPDTLIGHFYDYFGFDLTQLAFRHSSSIGLALSGSLCVIVDFGIGNVHR